MHVGPLVALALLSSIAGNWLSIPDLLSGAVLETTSICQRLADDRIGRRGRRRTVGTSPSTTAWPGQVPGHISAGGDRGADETADTESAVSADLTPSKAHQLHGDDLVARYVSSACGVGIGLAVVVYLRGYARDSAT